ncbi:hypothetical protein SeMB42_g06858 [Synchytrium endobioticum]|uniref:Cytochrome b mRNA-processing protein 4 n=1 Tax=Synchytrium endobioticum TaxID=286115 RepID=A0A507CI96_9FUNG|nr:hypothetical protein SeMB42_g06858 [Synchytrium endobioticum]TPX40022.1 hypothetical protein SeLEV6574_g06852 [Synchytrium endobioticum]
MSKFVSFTINSVLYGGSIMLVGYVAMKMAVPDAKEIEDISKRANQITPRTAAEKKNAELMKIIFDNAKTDRPIYDIQIPSAK